MKADYKFTIYADNWITILANDGEISLFNIACERCGIGYFIMYEKSYYCTICGHKLIFIET